MRRGERDATRDPSANGNGGGGNDFIIVVDLGEATKDVVNCGAGSDLVFADRKDVLNECERVRLP